MSDVSGIPYMGPMGQGNFFAPQFSYNPQINPTAGYAAPAAYAQNVTNNLYSSGGGFGTQTAYYAGLGASYGRQIASSDENPYRYGGVPESLAYPGASLSGGYTTGPANMPSFDTGPNFGYTSGGAGALDLSRSGGGGLGSSGGGYSGPTIDWSNVGRAAADPFPGMSMPGGLNSPLGGSSGASPFNWSDLWSGGGGHTSGIAPDTTGGRAPSVDWNNISSPPTSYGTFQGGGGGTGGYSSGIAPDTTGGRDFEWPAAEQAPGMAMPGGLGSPMTVPEASAKTQDQPAFDFSGPTAGWNNAPAPMPNSEQLLGYDPQKGPAEFDPNTFVSPSTNYDTFQGGGGMGGAEVSSADKSAQQIADEARARLADIIGSPETAKAVESPATDYDKFQQAATASAGERPADRVDMSLEGKVDALRNTVRKELEAQGLYMTSDYRGPGHDLYRPGSKHSDALAFDTRAKTPEQADATMGKIRELFDARGMVYGRDYTFIDEVRNPIGGITKGPHVHTTLTPEGMQQYQRSAYDVDAPRPPADIPYPEGIPLPTERPAEAGPSNVQDPNRPPANVPEFPAARLAPNGQAPEALIIHHTEGRPTLESTVEYWRSGSEGRGQGIGSQYFLDRDGVIHDVAAETNYTGTNHTKTADAASDQGAIGLGNHNTVGIEISAKNDADLNASQIAALKQFKAGVFPDIPAYGHSEIRSEKDPDEGRRGAKAILDAQGPLFNFDWSKAPIPDPTAAKGPSGVEKAQSFLNSSVDSLLQRYQPDKAGMASMFIDTKQTLREALKGPYGGQILEGLQPRLGEAGLNRNDLAKAIAAPPRFGGEGIMPPGDTGEGFAQPWNVPREGDPAWNTQVYDPVYSSAIQERGPETTAGSSQFSPFARSGNIDDRRTEQLTREQLEPLYARGWGYEQEPEVASTPLGVGLGLGDLPEPEGMAAGSARPQGATFNERLGPFGNTSMRDFPSPATDYSAFQQPASRGDLAKTMNFSGGFSPSPEPRSGGVGPEVSLEPDFMDVIQEVESSGNANKVTGRYKGLYQLDDKEFRKYGGTGDIFDPEQNTLAAGAKMVDETQRVQDILGRALTPPEQYMVHQQGVAGSLAHLANPDQIAWKNFQSASGRSEAGAKEAIWINMTPEMQKQFGNDVNNVTSRDFLRLWEDRYYGILNR